MALATLDVQELTTAVYLDEFEKDGFKYLQYLSYPRGGVNSDHFYLAHEIRMQPDFDHVVHGTVSACVDLTGAHSGAEIIYTPGMSWVFPGVENVLENKLVAGKTVPMVYYGEGFEITCSLHVLESIHCMVGPDFMGNC